ncbi:hypothetical protein [Planobispora rosea]|uniref:hypothetical protein n=1 Tax=Planobispora rosea TaxID=35762 RepID=UPI00083B484F|nr:hypothetical protein [Planobispora rosea]
MSRDKRRPLPEVEGTVKLDRGVGPTATTVAVAPPAEAVAAAPQGGEPIAGKVLDKKTPAFQVPSGPQYAPAPDDASPEDQLAHYERIVREASAAHEAARQRGDRYLALSAGQALREIRDHPHLYRSLGYRTFEEYIEHHLEFSRMHVYRIMRGVPVYLALPDVQELSFRQKDVLARAKDAEVIRAIWEKASAAGDTSPAGLKAARDELSIELVSAEKPENPERAGALVVTLPKVRRALERFFSVEALEQVASSAKKPEDVEEIASALEVAAAKLREAARS